MRWNYLISGIEFLTFISANIPKFDNNNFPKNQNDIMVKVVQRDNSKFVQPFPFEKYQKITNQQQLSIPYTPFQNPFEENKNYQSKAQLGKF